MRKIFCIVFSLLFCFAAYAEIKPQVKSISSPDGKIRLEFFLSQWGVPLYKMYVDGKPFIEESELGLIYNGNALSGHILDKVNYRWEVKELWHQPWGENKENISYFNEMAVTLSPAADSKVIMYFRLFNDGFAIKYDYDVANAGQVLVRGDCTTFAFSNGGTAWWIPADANSYEFEYKSTPISEVTQAATPITFRFDDGLYASVHEAALYNFPEMTLSQPQAGLFVSTLSQTVKNNDELKAVLPVKFSTPWRSVQIGRNAVDLINSSMILNLNEPSKIEDVSWIKPMKYIGIWWGMHLGVNSWTMDERHGATTKNAKRYIDFAAKHNIDAVLFEGWNDGWESWGKGQKFDYTKPYADFDMNEITSYARKRGIKIIGHHETGGNIPDYEQQLDTAMQWYKSYGIDYLKTGYAGGIPGGFTHHGQYGVGHYQTVVETAAKYKINLDVHEPIKDTGIRRTWPNMMTREGGRVMEWNAWSEGNSPAHTVTLPYTALLAGPIDYSPGIFDILYENTRDLPTRKKWNDNDKGNSRVNTTLAKQIANWVILYSPLQMAADLIENYEGHPAFKFFEDFNPDCDRSAALQGEIGEYIVVMRKAGDNYYLGASTDTTARKLNVPLDFLDKGVKYTATVYADGDKADWKTNPTDYKIYTRTVSATDTLDMQLAVGGGQAVVFKKAAGKKSK